MRHDHQEVTGGAAQAVQRAQLRLQGERGRKVVLRKRSEAQVCGMCLLSDIYYRFHRSLLELLLELTVVYSAASFK